MCSVFNPCNQILSLFFFFYIHIFFSLRISYLEINLIILLLVHTLLMTF